MKAYNYTEFRQNLASILNIVKSEGEVLVTRKNGDTFIIRPEIPKCSPFDIKGVNLGLSRDEIVSIVRESRETKR